MRISVNQQFQKSNHPWGFKPVEFDSAEELKSIVRTTDQVLGIFKNGHRGNERFISCDSLYLDVDSGLSLDEFRSHPDFEKCEYYVITSRSHDKPKLDKLNGEWVTCNRFHVILPVPTIHELEELQAKLDTMVATYPWADCNAKDPARFWFASPDAEVIHHPGKPYEPPPSPSSAPLLGDWRNSEPWAEESSEGPSGADDRKLKTPDRSLLPKLLECAQSEMFAGFNEWVKLGMALYADGFSELDWIMLSNPGEGNTGKHWKSFWKSGVKDVTGATLYEYVRRLDPEYRKRASATTEPVQQLVEVDLTDLQHAKVDPPQFAVETIVPRGVVTLAGGHGGVGKSMLALTICAHVACGRSWAGLGVDQGRALFVSLEDDGDLVRWRLKKLAYLFELDFKLLVANMTILDGSRAEAALMVEENKYHVSTFRETDIWKQIVSRARGCSFIVVDNASDAFDGNENTRRDVRRFIRMLAKLASLEKAGLLLLAHIDKAAAKGGSQGNAYSGSTAWHNSVRSRIALEPDGDRVKLTQEKTNLGRKLGSSVFFRWDGPVLVVDSPSGEELGADSGDVEAVLQAIRDAIEQGVSVPVSRSSGTNFWNCIKTYPTARGLKKESAYNALNALVQSGRVERESYVKDYKARERFIVPAKESPPMEDSLPSPTPP